MIWVQFFFLEVRSHCSWVSGEILIIMAASENSGVLDGTKKMAQLFPPEVDRYFLFLKDELIEVNDV